MAKLGKHPVILCCYAPEIGCQTLPANWENRPKCQPEQERFQRTRIYIEWAWL